MFSPVNLDLSPVLSRLVPGRLVLRRLAALTARLWPAHCLGCAATIAPGGRDLCPACTRGLPWNHCACLRCGLPLPSSLPLAAEACGRCRRRPPPLTETRAVFRYEAPLDRLLPRLKFHDDLAAGRLCADLMAEALAGAARPDALIPLPLHRRRLRTRGYDQTLELARPLARVLALPLRDDLLTRGRDTAPQSRLDAVARRRNLKDAFAVRPGIALPAHVALIDDVMTTGATLHAAADALLRAGVVRVDAWVCARVA